MRLEPWKLAALALLLCIHGGLVASDPLLQRDDLHIIKTMRDREAPGLAGFWIHQPVRDASLRLDLSARDHLGLGTFHLSNLLIWLLAMLALRRLLGRIRPDRPGLADAIALLFAVHPVFVGSVAWVAARKHLLAFLFIVLATDRFVALKRDPRARGVALTLLFYALSVLSHPITLLWPAWAALHLRLARMQRPAGWVPGLAAPVLLAGAWLNYSYYAGDYVRFTAQSKLVDASGIDAGFVPLAFGRYFFNLVCPLRLSAVYDPGSAWNLAGLAALLAGLTALALRARRAPARVPREAWSWIFLSFVSIAPVTLVLTNIFVSDTYVLTAAAGLAALAIGLAAPAAGPAPSGERPPRLPRGAVPVALAALTLSGISLVQARSWRSDEALWEHAARVEPAPRALSLRARFLIDRGALLEAARLIDRLRERDPGHADLDLLDSRVIYAATRLPLDEKRRALEALPAGAWRDYHLAAVLGALGQFEHSHRRIRLALEFPSRFHAELPVVLAEAAHLCRRAKAADCGSLVEATLERCRRGPGAGFCQWNDGKFNSRLEELERGVP